MTGIIVTRGLPETLIPEAPNLSQCSDLLAAEAEIRHRKREGELVAWQLQTVIGAAKWSRRCPVPVDQTAEDTHRRHPPLWRCSTAA